MIRSFLILLGIIVLIALALSATHDAGAFELNWLHYRVDMSAVTGVIVIGIMTFCAVAFWNLALWLANSPARAERARAEARRRQGDETLTRGFVSVATGDGNEARRLAIKAVDLCDNTLLVRILGAMAAETSDDPAAAKAAYTAMLNIPELKLGGLKGLTQVARGQGDKAEAARLAGEAFSQSRPGMWAFETLFEARLEAGEWSEALELIDGALTRKLISPLFSDRAKTALMAASAARMETDSVAKVREQALDYAVRAAKLQPAFTPAALIAARLLGRANKTARAEDMLEAAWAANPHPAIWMTYRDLVSDETPKERARRLKGLVDRNPGHRESRLLQLERAMLNASKVEIIAALTALEPDAADNVITKRVAGLIARGAQASGNADAARTWLAQAVLARSEPDWSDIDSDGKAFNYSASDWSDIILSFAQTGKLTHPRFERGDKGLAEVPELPSRYVPSMPFIKAAQRQVGGVVNPTPLPDNLGIFDPFDAAITGQDLDAPDEAETPKIARARRTPAKAKK